MEHKQSFWTKYLFSTDHKTIGIQYGITALFFFIFWFLFDAFDALAISLPWAGYSFYRTVSR